jgi:1A family penicillin-binding protein
MMTDHEKEHNGFTSRIMNSMNREAAQSTRRRFGWKTAVGALLFSTVAIASAGAGAWIYTRPSLDQMEARTFTAPFLQDASGEPLVLGQNEATEYVPLDRMPEMLAEAVISLEDRRFFDHGGVDLWAIGRAMVSNYSAGSIVEGGSTITQQLIKISYLSSEKSYMRKAHEALLARQMEDRFTKEEILERYLNQVYFGSGAYGVQAAARTYFDKEVEELSLGEAAILAATIRAPSEVNPYRNSNAVRDRATLVINLMQRQGRIHRDVANTARIDIATMSFHRAPSLYGAWFADWVDGEAESIARRLDGPVTLRTTLDPAMQKRAEEVVNEVLDGTEMQGALVALRPDGSVAAMVGGRDYSQSQFNRATSAVRQPGSTFKTFVFLTALAEGLGPDDTVADKPIDLNGYAPENYDGRYRGSVTLREAFARSLNVPAVTLAMHVGLDEIIENARALGIEADLSATPSLALGASGMTLLDLTEAYAALATGEAPVTARGLAGISTDGSNYQRFRWTKPPLSPRAAKLMEHRMEMAELLQGVVLNGTGKRVQEIPGAVGKTGTSQNFRDALFVGWNGEYIVGVWVGNDDNSPMDKVTGGSLPSDIWAKFLGEEAQPKPAQPETAEVAMADASGEAPQDGTVITDAPAVASANMMSLRDLTAALTQAQEDRASCNVNACARAYRSFRASDCTFQPYGNRPRELCTR